MRKIKAGLQIGFVVGAFIFISYLAQSNTEFFEELIKNDAVGMIVYFFLVVIAIVIAPFEIFLFHPVVANVWGWIIAGFLIWGGVCVGSLIAFVLSRKYGVKLVRKFISLEKIHKIESKIPERNLFLSVLILRMILPAEIVSYFFGLFSKIKLLPYMIATIIGTMPLAFLVSYVGTIPMILQIDVVLIFLIIVMVGVIVKLYKKGK